MPPDCVLCVDDEAIILASLKVELRNEFGKDLDIEVAMSGQEGLDLAASIKAEGRNLLLAVTDQRMPGMDGSEFLIRLKKRFPDVLGIMLTGFSEVDSIKRAINEAGLFRFISKPWSSLDIRMAVRQAVEHRRLAILNAKLARQVEAMNRTILATLESVVDINDPDTYDHVRRVSVYAEEIARLAGQDQGFRRRILFFSPLHDIGKIGINRDILGKPGALSEAERAIMMTHVEIGQRLVRNIDADPILCQIIRSHHERWDGMGYPDGLAGEAIPFAARIIAIADVFDALLSDRPYKKALDFESAVEIIRSGRGSHFDPRLVDAFLSGENRLRAIASGEDTSDIVSDQEIG
ncbi:MAG TPA: HD domain-containing phosphohydrolase [Rectinemataceae bacterium]|nr:HD domain-containing phosphohydrolase [Rectinemataceae bacterium]